ncbi:carotenoid oxygenase family protein [Conexibacter sp. SYSU D00693]|uniref:carotenoid oxygenase family protein n=1 Tax=Conexibacter sp. SYSU D00693 TaxID=2812560 RepID=UPI00196B7833|nr:carotenoid oxygenase family protein [Conexibacter sp. SYSU D00693]
MTATATKGAVLGFQDADAEVTPTELAVEGELPPWLRGSLLRTGPARWDVGGRPVNHWFDGLAKLHRFAFADGRVDYASRFLRSRAFEAAQAEGRIAFREFATDPCRSAFKRVTTLFDPAKDFSDNGAVNVMALGDRWQALTETPMPVAFDPDTLETLGVGQPPPAGHHTTAHPHADGDELWGHGVHFGPRSSYVVYAQRPGGDQRVVGRLPVRRPAYHHAFSLTPRRAVLAEGPFTVDPLRLALGGRSFAASFAWDGAHPSRFLAVDRATGRPAGTWEAEPFFCFHHVNAFEDGEDLVVDLLAYDDAAIVEALALERLRAGQAPPTPQLRRYRLRPGEDTATGEPLAEVRFELPVIDYGRVNGRPYRHVWGVGASERSGWFDRIVHTDVTTGEQRAWHEPGLHPGEPVLAPRPGATSEDDGVLLTVALEPAAGTSALVVLDAATLEERARARVPHHIPFGFHGQFARREDR